MATALQQQLAAIAANSTHQLDLKVQKARHSKSLLFEPRDAATQSFDTIYQICWEGFVELCQLDARFVPFERNLFSEQSKSEDRSQMTAQENLELDGVLGSFLGLLGGRLLLKPAIKAVEWLVRRFRVDECNTEAFLLTFLPYHSAQIFPTLMSILPDQLPANFRFLHPYVASLECPPRHAVVSAATNNPALFTAFGQNVLNVAKARHGSALVFGFWASITAQAVDGMVNASRSGRDSVRRQKEQDILLRVLPILQAALNIRDVPELFLASCVIITILVTKIPLEEKVIDTMMEAVVTAWTESTVEQGLTCLAILAEEKQQPSLPREVTQAMLSNGETLRRIEEVASTCRVGRLLAGASIGAISNVSANDDGQALEFLKGVLDSQLLSTKEAGLVFGTLLQAFSTDPDSQTHGADTLISLANVYAEREEYAAIFREAADRVQVNVASFDPQLGLLLSEGRIDDEPDSEAEEMDLDEEPKHVSTSDKRSRDLLKKLVGIEHSLLDPSQSTSFEEQANLIRHCWLSRGDVQSLNFDTTQTQKVARKPGFFSFLAHLWTREAAASVRTNALLVASQELDHIAKKEVSSSNYQALLPYVVTALADEAKSVRSAAASCCQALFRSYTSLADKKKSQEDSKIWGKDSIYGAESSKLHWLSTDHVQKFVIGTLAPIVGDSVLDKNYIVQALVDSLNASSSISQAGQKELSAALRTSVATFLASHAVASPVLSVQLRLLDILNKLGKSGSTARASALLPYTRECLTNPLADASLKKALINSLTHRTPDEVQLLQQIASTQLGANVKDTEMAFARWRHVWHKIKAPAQNDIADWLLDLGLSESATEEVQSEATESLRSVVLPTSVLAHLLEKLPRVSDLQEQPKSAKRQRTSRLSDTPRPGSVEKEKLTTAIRRITLVLELVEESKPEKHPELLKGLFQLLSELHHYKTLLDSELVYIQGLLISNLLAVVTGLKQSNNKDFDRSVIRADLIVECVRTTSSTQVQQTALLLMSALASWVPELVLHSVMPLFTFMSSTILKQGDDYSAHVTEQTVTQIIPPLAASLKKRGKDLVTGAADLLLSFTAAFEHIPMHRRAGLFKHLVQTLGASQSLYAIVAMLVERYSDDPIVVPFVADLMDKFPTIVQLEAMKQYLDLVSDTTRPKRALADVILGFAEKNEDQAEDATQALLVGLSGILARASLRKKLVKDLRKGGEEAQQIRKIYAELLQRTMDLALLLSDDDASLDDGSDGVLKALLGVMPTPDFIDTSAQLMQGGSDEMRRQVFASLEQRASSAKRGDPEMQKIFIEVLPNCSIFIAESQPTITRRAAIACIDHISEKFGKTDRGAVLEAAHHVAGPAALGSKIDDLRISALLCLASMVEVLGDEFVSILPKTMDQALQCLSDVFVDDSDSQALHGAAFSFAIAVLDYVPWVLSGPYLIQLVKLAAQSASAASGQVDASSTQQFCNLAAKQISVPELLEAVKHTWEDVVQYGFKSVQQHLNLLQQIIQNHAKSTIKGVAEPLFQIMMLAFDLRASLSRDQRDEAVPVEILSLVDNVAMSMVLKLDDATFRPFFLRLADWIEDDDDVSVFRCTSLYSFAATLFDQLKSLVTSYYGYLLENTVSILTKSMSSSGASGPSQRALLDTVLQALTVNLRHDQDGFWQSPAHFDAIMSPLVDLIKKARTLPVDAYLIPAITELAVVIASGDHYKTLNSSIMLLMRHEHAAVRLAAVKCERAITEKLGLDWLSLLPEMLPFISELQEDDDAAVESEALQWVTQIEGVTGESLENMLQ